MRYRHSVISEITARRRNHTMRIARKIHISERYKNTKNTRIRIYGIYGRYKDSRYTPFPPSSPSPVSWGGATSIQVRSIDIYGHYVYRTIHTADALEKLYI